MGLPSLIESLTLVEDYCSDKNKCFPLSLLLLIVFRTSLSVTRASITCSPLGGLYDFGWGLGEVVIPEV